MRGHCGVVTMEGSLRVEGRLILWLRLMNERVVVELHIVALLRMSDRRLEVLLLLLLLLLLMLSERELVFLIGTTREGRHRRRKRVPRRGLRAGHEGGEKVLRGLGLGEGPVAEAGRAIRRVARGDEDRAGDLRRRV